MHALDIAIAISTLEVNPDPKKADAFRDELRLALQRREISAEIYSQTLALLKRASGPLTLPNPATV